MDSGNEVIALLLDTGTLGEPSHDRRLGAQRLVRGPDGRISLETIESDEEFERTARTTG